jgi:hypothetical protein
MILQNSLKALPVSTITPSLRLGVRNALMLTGLGPMRPNTLVLPWVGVSVDMTPKEYGEILRVLYLRSSITSCRI